MIAAANLVMSAPPRWLWCRVSLVIDWFWTRQSTIRGMQAPLSWFQDRFKKRKLVLCIPEKMVMKMSSVTSQWSKHMISRFLNFCIILTMLPVIYGSSTLDEKSNVKRRSSFMIDSISAPDLWSGTSKCSNSRFLMEQPGFPKI